MKNELFWTKNVIGKPRIWDIIKLRGSNALFNEIKIMLSLHKHTFQMSYSRKKTTNKNTIVETRL